MMVKFFNDSFMSSFFAYLSVELVGMLLLIKADDFAGISLFNLPIVDSLYLLIPPYD